MKSFVFILLLSLSFSTFSADIDFCTDKLGNLPIQQGGRIKPLYVHAAESIKYITEKSKVGDVSAVTAYCFLSFHSMGIDNKLVWKATVQHHQLREKFELKEKRVSLDTLLETKDELVLEWRKQKDETSYKKSLDKLLRRIQLYEEIKNGANWLLYEKIESEGKWVILPEFLKKEKVEKESKSSTTPFSNVLMKSESDYISDHGDDFKLELTFAKLKLPLWALSLTLLGLASLVLTSNLYAPLFFALSTVAVETVYITLRVIISGRAPVTNMYETVLFSG
ncbi:MAG: hypothetical protein KC493_14010, partial [Bacteriovoracaceae bacterium]|nr:hypothetical protein [Bacteriovoracaceae bacterium]